MAVAERLVPLILEHRHETEQRREPAPAIVEEIRATRLSLLTLPSEQGGLGASLVEALQTFEILAGAEPSVPWLLWNTSQVCMFARFLPESTRDVLFADPRSLYAISAIPAGRAVATPDGYRVSGRWPLVSGCTLADWFVLACTVTDPDDPGPRATDHVAVPRDQVEIIDTWHTGGMRGTGSHDIALEDALVPRSMTLLSSEFPAPSRHPVHRIPLAASLTAGLGAHLLGAAASALRAVIDQARSSTASGPTPSMRERSRAQEAVARHGAAVDAARSHLIGRAGHLWDLAVEGTRPNPSEIADLHAASLHAMEVSGAAVDSMCAVAGTASVYTRSPLERIHRDVHVMLHHRLAGIPRLEEVGRIRFGLDPTDPLFLS